MNRAGKRLASRSGMLLSIEELRGRPVVASDGHVVGELATILVDTRSWSVATIRLKLRKDIADRVGVHRSVFHSPTLEIPARAIQSVAEAIVLAVPVGELRTLKQERETSEEQEPGEARVYQRSTEERGQERAPIEPPPPRPIH
jgi:sporulation protein YlmC with PRC-barrel domain